MATLSEISAGTGIRSDLLWKLQRYGFEFEEDNFDIDAHHQKALNELNRCRMSPYVIAYALRCRTQGSEEHFARYDNLVSISKIRRLSIEGAFFDVRANQIEGELLPTAKHWIDRAAGCGSDMDALDRIGRWCKAVLAAGPHTAVEHSYLASRLLMSLSYEDMLKYPKPVSTALNKVAHYGHLDGCHRKEPNPDGTKRNVYFRPKYEL